MNRGNHEQRDLNERPFANGGGFAWEVRRKYPHDENLIELFQRFFMLLPIASVSHTGLEPQASRQAPRQVCYSYSHARASPRVGQVVGSWAFVIHGGLFRDTSVTLDDLRKVYQAPAPASPDPDPYPYP